ncbi:MAG: hypothetical protein HYV90_05710 [Candidatus Woesebacteria bacterium]|nr:MAG: hypothetical protein HYV90_05710 [Candidatus Woesebacteria bacterium]
MKLSKEIWLVVAFVAFLLAWLIDRLAGPVSIAVGNPIAFLSSSRLLNTYPFTATAIIIRTLAIFISAMLILSLFNRKYFTKAVVLFFICVLAEFFSIQQLATGFRVTTIQWTLSIAYASLILGVGIVWLILMGIWASFNKETTSTESSSEAREDSVLTPPESE